MVEPHTEDTEDPKLAHQELYFVATGRATFTIDGVAHDAPAGTYVFVPDPASHRHAVAAEGGTTVLSFGGPATFTPSSWEWAFRATPYIRSDPDQARAILRDGLEHDPRAAGLHYNLACVEAVRGDRDAALSALRTALEIRPEAAGWAREDADLESLRGDDGFEELVGGSA